MTWFLAVALLFALAVNVGVIASLWVQRSMKVPTPDGRTIRIRLTAAGVGWIPWTNWDGSWIAATYWWVRYRRGGRRTWTITGTPKWGDTVLLGELATRTAALHEFHDLAEQVASGQVKVP